MPYEFYPLPEKDEEVDVLNNYGENIGTGIIRKKIKSKKNEKTIIIGVSVPKKIFESARSIRLKREDWLWKKRIITLSVGVKK